MGAILTKMAILEIGKLLFHGYRILHGAILTEMIILKQNNIHLIFWDRRSNVIWETYIDPKNSDNASIPKDLKVNVCKLQSDN